MPPDTRAASRPGPRTAAVSASSPGGARSKLKPDRLRAPLRPNSKGFIASLEDSYGTLSTGALVQLDAALDEQAEVHDKAATAIQAAIRGKIARVDRRESVEAAVVLQSFARGGFVRFKVEGQRGAAVVLQSVFRGVKVRLSIKSLVTLSGGRKRKVPHRR